MNKAKNTTYALLLFVMLISLLVVIPTTLDKGSVQPIGQESNTSSFIISSWDFPETDGSGLYLVRFNLDGNIIADFHYYNTTNTFDTVANSSVLSMDVFYYANITTLGASDSADGLNYIRHNVTVRLAINNTVVFSKQNFTYIQTTGDDPIYIYKHSVDLSFTREQGVIYTLDLMIELWE